jgi:hypothetical protein
LGLCACCEVRCGLSWGLFGGYLQYSRRVERPLLALALCYKWKPDNTYAHLRVVPALALSFWKLSMDWPAWKKALTLYVNTPELIGASVWIASGIVVAVIAIVGFVWWLRGHTGKEHEAALNTRIATLEGSLRDTKDAARDAHERITQVVDVLTAQNAELASTIKEMEKSKHPIPPQQLTVQLNLLSNTSATIAGNITSLSTANTELATALTAEHFSVVPPTFGKPTLTERSD